MAPLNPIRLRLKVSFDSEKAEKIMHEFKERLAECITVSACDATDASVSIECGGCAPPVFAVPEPTWIEWRGSPRAPEFPLWATHFQLRFRGDDDVPAPTSWFPVGSAHIFDWKHSICSGDIVAYRVRPAQ